MTEFNKRSRGGALIGLLAAGALVASCTAQLLAAEPARPDRAFGQSLHRRALEVHRHAPIHPSLHGDSAQPLIPLQPRAPLRMGGASARPCRTVFGYLPYWENADNVRYDLLTHLAVFRVRVNADGSLGDDAGWPWTAVINEAHEHGVKVILTAILFNQSDILTLMTTPAYKQRFFVNIRDKVRKGLADGVNIDFEDGEREWAGYLNGFMADLTAYLHAEIPGSEVTVTGPIINWGDAYDFAGLAASCDGVFIMGYNYAGNWSNKSGANAPLTGGSANMTDTVENQYAAVTYTHPEKLILGVPYYGQQWTTVSDAPRAWTTSHIDWPYFRVAKPQSIVHGLRWDEVSQTPWYTWHDGTTWNQVWFDNADSLRLKFQLAKDHDYQGVGIWALGYDGTQTDLWNLIETEFGGCSSFADYDYDGDTDGIDWLDFEECFRGPGKLHATTDLCLLGDIDNDRDIDLCDYAEFMRRAAKSN